MDKKLSFFNRYYEKIGKQVKDITDDLPFDIPNNWTWIRLGNLCRIKLGKTPERHNHSMWENNGINWFTIADMIDKTYVSKTKEFVSHKAIESTFSGEISPRGTLLLSFKLTVGRTSILDIDAVHNEAIASLFSIINIKIITKNYLFNTLGLLVDYCDKTTAIKGNTLNKEKLNNMYIPLPPLEEQQRIVEKIENELYELDSTIKEKLKKSILQYAIQGKLVKQDPNDEPASVLLEHIKAEKEQLIKEGKIKRDKNESYIYQGDDKNYYEKVGIINKKINDIFDIPTSWKYIKISEVIEVARGGSPRPIQHYITLEKNGLNWIKIGDTDVNSKYIVSCKEKIKPSGLKKTRFVKKGDFLLTNSMSFGHPYILKIDGCIHDGWLVLSDRYNMYDKNFLYYLLSSPYVYKSFCSSVGGSVVKNLNSDKVSNTIIPILSLNEQKRISEKLDLIFNNLLINLYS